MRISNFRVRRDAEGALLELGELVARRKRNGCPDRAGVMRAQLRKAWESRAPRERAIIAASTACPALTQSPKNALCTSRSAPATGSDS